MKAQRWIKDFIAVHDRLEMEYLISRGWTFAIVSPGPVKVWTRAIEGKKYTIGQSMAYQVQEWLDYLGDDGE